MRWFVLILFTLLSAYLLYLALFNAWASATPVADPEVFKTRFYCLLSCSFVTLGLGVNAFLLMREKLPVSPENEESTH